MPMRSSAAWPSVSTISAPGRMGKPGKWSAKTSSVALTFRSVSIERPGSTATMRSTKTKRTRAPSGPRGEARAGGELADDVVAHRAHGEPAHHRLDRGGRVEALSEIAGEAVHGQARQIERGAVEIGEHPHGERPHDLPPLARSAAGAR